jgi:DNA-binding transcriptional LysR family regulator
MRINFLGLQAFLSVAEGGSFRSAANNLNLSQTAISHRIRKLEEELGLKLFARTTREVALTRAGVDLIDKAKTAVLELEGSLDQIRQQGAKRRRRLCIACLPAFAIYRLPPVLSKFRSTDPDVQVQIFEVASSEVAGLLQREEVEFGLSVASTNRWDLDVETLINSDPLVLACRSNHELSRRKSVRWADLREFPLIRVGTGTSIRPLIDEALGPLNNELNWAYEIERVETAVCLVEAGCGITVVPRSNVELHGSKAVIGKPIHEPSLTCAFGLVTKRGVPLSPTAERFRALLRERIEAEQRHMKNIR